MQQMRLSKPPEFQEVGTERVRVEPTTNRDHAVDSVMFTGLCRTCNHSPTCTLPRCEHRPVMFCEEFDGVVRATTTMAMTRRPPPAGQDQGICETGHPSKYRGLCRTCEHREDCAFPRAEGGVWRCEEFV